MGLTDALTITGLGMGVVFIGLLMTAGLIVSFSLLPRLLDRSPAARGTEEPTDPGALADARRTPVPPEIVAVITAVLEVERRLYHADLGSRLTIQRPERAP